MERSWIPTVTGVLNIVAGGLALLGAAGLSFAVFVIRHAPDVDRDEFGVLIAESVLTFVALTALVVAVLAVLGGVCALRRGRWGWVLAGAIAAAFAFPPLGFPAVVLAILAEKELRAAGRMPLSSQTESESLNR
jgi:hypothetical protein